MISVLVILTCLGAAYSATFSTAPNYFGQVYLTQDSPRGIFLDESGDVLYISDGRRSVFSLKEIEHEDGTIGLTEAELVNGRALGIALNHAVVHHEGYLYASSDTTVYRWAYVAGSQELGADVPMEIVISGMPPFGHITRTLAFDAESVLYVSVGSNANIDPDSERARVRRFDLSGGVAFPIDFSTGEVFADGLRNEVGLAFDKTGILWGVENSGDRLVRDDLGGDIHNGNPAEEMNRFDGAVGSHYGYPYCFGSYDLEGYEPLTQFVWPDFMDNGIHSDEWCRNVTNNRVPHLAFPAHTAPLGIAFYDGEGCQSEASGAFPCEFEGDAFVALHGSWNSDIPVGYKVIHIPFTKTAPFLPTGEILDIIYEPDLATCYERGNCFRPVNAVFNKNGHLIISVDTSDELFKVTYGTPPPTIRMS